MAVSVKLKKRLKTVKGLNSIFEALEVITATRIKKIRQKHNIAQRYLKAVGEAAATIDFSPLFSARRTKRTMAVVFSANRGFTGAFDQNLFFRIRSFISETSRPEFIVFGQRGTDFLRAEKQIIAEASAREDLGAAFFADLAEQITGRYFAGQLDRLFIIHNQFRSVVRQDAAANLALPLESAGRPSGLTIVEPNRRLAAEKLCRQLLAGRLYFSYLDSELGEISARMFTLKGALENSKEMISALTLQLNKERQQSITGELLEIISSAESIKEAGD